MALMFHSSGDDPAAWGRDLKARIPDLEVRVWPQVEPLEDIEFALVWEPPPGDLARYPNLKAIFTLSAGVDHVFADPDLPAGVPIARIVDPDLAAQVSEWIAAMTLGFHRRLPAYAAQQRQRVWHNLGRTNAADRRVGIMGVGVIGGATARKLLGLGFAVRGYEVAEVAPAAAAIEGIEWFRGPGRFADFLAETDILVCVLPLTPETRGIINRETLAGLPAGAHVINAARGAHVVDADLIAALDSGHLAGAALDVFETEPLPPEHPYWSHPGVILTPHIAGDPNPRTAADQVAENIRRARAGRPLLNTVDPARQY